MNKKLLRLSQETKSDKGGGEASISRTLCEARTLTRGKKHVNKEYRLLAPSEKPEASSITVHCALTDKLIL